MEIKTVTYQCPNCNAALEYNNYTASAQTLAGYAKLPGTLHEAQTLASESEFIRAHLPQPVLSAFCRR